MDIRTLHSESDYRAALAEVSRLVDLDPAVDTPEGKRLEILATLVEAWEARHFPVLPPDPMEASQFRREQSYQSWF